jgi:periplasmic protein TonB
MKYLIIILSSFFLSINLLAQNEVKPPKTEASYTGGSGEMTNYLSKNLKVQKNKIVEGIVYVEFFIENDGTITNAKVLKGINADLDKIALETVTKMPKWVPAKDENNKPIRSKMVLPIKYSK